MLQTQETCMYRSCSCFRPQVLHRAAPSICRFHHQNLHTSVWLMARNEYPCAHLVLLSDIHMLYPVLAPAPTPFRTRQASTAVSLTHTAPSLRPTPHPGPGAYIVPRPQPGPAFSMGVRPVVPGPDASTSPAPGDYDAWGVADPGPAFTLGARRPEPSQPTSPGPGATGLLPHA